MRRQLSPAKLRQADDSLRFLQMRSTTKILYALAMAFVIIATLLTVRYRPAWSDEGQYVDPGANLMLGRGFVSTAWDSCSPGQAWGSSTPGFPLFFSLIFKAFGFDIWAARAVFFLAHLVGALLIIRWAHRSYGLSAASMLGCLVVFMGAPALSHHALYNPRLECFALLFCAVFLTCLDCWQAGKWRVAIGLFVFGFVVAMTGLHFAFFFAVAAAIAFLLDPGWSRLRFGLTLGAGMLLSVFVLRASYLHLGVWEQFIAHRMAHYGRDLPWVPRGAWRFSVTKDLGIFAAGCACVFLWELCARRDDGWRERARILGGILLLVLAVPMIVGTIGIWHAGYAWMVGVPMTLGVAYLFRKPPTLPLRALAMLGLLLGLAGVAREVRKIPSGLRDEQLRKQAVQELNILLKENEKVASTFDFYYELRPMEPMVFFRCEHESRLSLGFKRELYFPERAQAETRWLLACESEAPAYLEGLGGSWAEVRRYKRDHAKGDYCLLRRQAVPSESK